MIASAGLDGTVLLWDARTSSPEPFMTISDVAVAGESIDIPYDLLSDEATVSVVYGENITHELCNDAFWLEVIEKKRFEVTAGTATLRISPDPDTTEGSPELPADAILYLSNVVLEAPDGERAEFEQFTFQASVGWLPG